MGDELGTQKKHRAEELEITKRELDLQEKRYEEEKAERSQHNEANKAMLDLLKVLSNELDKS